MELGLQDGETVDAVVFGGWGGAESRWNDALDRVPKHLLGVPMKLEDARQFMGDWSFDGGFGSPDCHSVHVWTDRRVLFVATYDGATWLSSVPRHPAPGNPFLHGG
jgi:hypothetical protein